MAVYATNPAMLPLFKFRTHPQDIQLVSLLQAEYEARGVRAVWPE